MESVLHKSVKICTIYLLQNGQKSIINHLLLLISTSPINSIQYKIFSKYIICNNSKTIKNGSAFLLFILIIIVRKLNQGKQNR